VSLTSPANGATFTAPATINLTANAADADGSVSKVDFYNGTFLLNTDTTTPYSFSWTNVAAGTYSLTAVATDNAGGVTTSAVVSVTVSGSGNGTTYTVFQPAAAPTGRLQNDGQAVQLGMKFRSSVAGNVTGVRFYKQSGNTGTHRGQLYSSTGTLLADATFINESASGWQQVNFTSPVAITANTTYIISYHSSSGYYSETVRGFSSSVVNGPLTALANGTDGGNGVYKYGASPVFPTESFRSTNYWVDLVFSPTATLATSIENSLTNSVSKASQKSDLLEKEELEIYPNPFSSKATVSFILSKAGDYTVELYNINGALVKILKQGQAKAGARTTVEVEGSKLAKGLYLVRLQTNTGTQIKKLMLDK
jgi:hypothetical protein